MRTEDDSSALLLACDRRSPPAAPASRRSSTADTGAEPAAEAALPGHDRAQVRHDHDRVGARSASSSPGCASRTRCSRWASCRSRRPSGTASTPARSSPGPRTSSATREPPTVLDSTGRRRDREDRRAAPRPRSSPSTPGSTEEGVRGALEARARRRPAARARSTTARPGRRRRSSPARRSASRTGAAARRRDREADRRRRRRAPGVQGPDRRRSSPTTRASSSTARRTSARGMLEELGFEYPGGARRRVPGGVRRPALRREARTPSTSARSSGSPTATAAWPSQGATRSTRKLNVRKEGRDVFIARRRPRLRGDLVPVGAEHADADGGAGAAPGGSGRRRPDDLDRPDRVGKSSRRRSAPAAGATGCPGRTTRCSCRCRRTSPSPRVRRRAQVHDRSSA